MTWWGYVIVYVGLGINLGSLAINWITILRTRKQIMRVHKQAQDIEKIIQTAKLLGYQQGYRDGSVK